LKRYKHKTPRGRR